MEASGNDTKAPPSAPAERYLMQVRLTRGQCQLKIFTYIQRPVKTWGYMERLVNPDVHCEGHLGTGRESIKRKNRAGRESQL